MRGDLSGVIHSAPQVATCEAEHLPAYGKCSSAALVASSAAEGTPTSRVSRRSDFGVPAAPHCFNVFPLAVLRRTQESPHLNESSAV
jgi:hypothetical protein